MKKLLLFSIFWISTSVVLFGQDKPITWSSYIFKKIGNPLDYVGKEVSIKLSLKHPNKEILYEEMFSTTVGEGGLVKVTFGKGMIDPGFEFVDFKLAYAASDTICYKMTVNTNPGEVMLMGKTAVTDAPSSHFAFLATEAKQLDGYSLNKTPRDFTQLFDDLGYFDVLMAYTNDIPPDELKEFALFRANSLINFSTSASAVNGSTINVIGLGTGNPYPIAFTNMPMDTTESYYTACPLQPENFYNGWGVKMPNTGTPYGHTTAAIYGANIYDVQGTGIFGNGRARGSYNQGQTGAFGICNNTTGNGAGVWGYILNAPLSGSANYALLGSSNGHPNTYGALIDGNLYVTGTTSGPSDRSLKTDIRNEESGLSKILKLRPTQFKYIENSSLSLPPGKHHGFIAQELEEIIPELVSDVVLPASFDPDKMATSGSITIKGINYIELIPLLTQALQELNTKVEAQSAQITELGKQLQACSKSK